MKTAVVLLFSLIPLGVLAGQYTCTSKSFRGPKTMEASSEAEAKYKIGEQYPRVVALGCRNAVVSDDVFVRDIRFSQNKQLRPYIPSDLRPSGKAGYACNSSGGFKADNDPVIGGCAFYISSSPPAEWRIRFMGNGTANKVWRMTQGTWAPWVELGEPPNVYEVVSISPQAQQFSATHRAGQQPASSQRVNPTDNSAPSSPIANPNPIDDLVKQGIGGLLKGFGR